MPVLIIGGEELVGAENLRKILKAQTLEQAVTESDRDRLVEALTEHGAKVSEDGNSLSVEDVVFYFNKDGKIRGIRMKEPASDVPTA